MSKNQRERDMGPIRKVYSILNTPCATGMSPIRMSSFALLALSCFHNYEKVGLGNTVGLYKDFQISAEVKSHREAMLNGINRVQDSDYEPKEMSHKDVFAYQI